MLTAKTIEQLEAMKRLEASGRAITFQGLIEKLDFRFQPISFVPRRLYSYDVVFADRFGKFKATFWENSRRALILDSIEWEEENREEQ